MKLHIILIFILLNLATASAQEWKISFSLPSYRMEDSLLWAEGLDSRERLPGEVDVPVWQRLVALPKGSVPTMVVESEESEVVPLEQPLRRVAPIRTKEGTLISATKASKEPPTLVSLTPLGTLRYADLYRLTLRPLLPKGDSLKVCRSLRILLSAKGEIIAPKGLYNNSLTFDGEAPGYLIVAREAYREALQPLVRWKRQCGFAVEELYPTHHSKDSVRNMLTGRYQASTAENPFPPFLLLVGGTADFPPFFTTSQPAGLDMSFSDLPYGEYTGDHLPETLVGRLPVRDTATLRLLIDKLIAYEQCRLADTAYLSRTLLLAGNESRTPAPMLTNGQVDYLAQAFAHAGLDTLCLRNPAFDTVPPPWTESRKDSVLALLAHGAALVNYTGHAKYWGWSSPVVSASDIDALPATGRYTFMVNNCCSSNAFGGNSFGEHCLLKTGGGAIGVIGATNETLWEEDCLWALGNKPLCPSNAYDSAALGPFDRLLHSHGEPPSQWALTAGQMLLAGNLSVEESGSPFSPYYWETYLLLGDPSLMPYLGQPTPIELTLHDTLSLHTTSLSLSGTPGAYVALAQSNALLGVCLLDSDGQGLMSLLAPPTDSLLTLTARLPGHCPWMDTLRVADYPSICPQQPLQPSATRIYPNPCSGRVTVERSADTPAQLTIYSPLGQRLRSVDAPSRRTTLSLAYLPNVAYLIAVQSATEYSLHPLILQR